MKHRYCVRLLSTNRTYKGKKKWRGNCSSWYGGKAISKAINRLLNSSRVCKW